MNIKSPEEFEKIVRSVLINKSKPSVRREQAQHLVIDMLSVLGYERGAALADEMIRAKPAPQDGVIPIGGVDSLIVDSEE